MGRPRREGLQPIPHRHGELASALPSLCLARCAQLLCVLQAHHFDMGTFTFEESKAAPPLVSQLLALVPSRVFGVLVVAQDIPVDRVRYAWNERFQQLLDQPDR